MTINWCDKFDPRLKTLQKGSNVRWPSDTRGADLIAICENTRDVIEALDTGATSISIRSGGHCYEGFVANNKSGMIIDVGMLNSVGKEEPRRVTIVGNDVVLEPVRGLDGDYYRIGAGVQNWDGYVGMYKRWGEGKTLPGGSCYSVGVGGHISGGGFGYMSRLHGLTVDWLSAVGIVTWSTQNSKATHRVVHAGSVNADGSVNQQERDLFRALRGAGNGNFGVITDYYFKELPSPPKEAMITQISFTWAQFSDAAQLKRFLNIFVNYWKQAEGNQDMDRLFGVVKLTHSQSGNILIRLQCPSKGTNNVIDSDDTKLVNDFIALFKDFSPKFEQQEASHLPDEHPVRWTGKGGKQPRADLQLPPGTVLYDWLNAVQQLNGAGANTRGKYKSTYMKTEFSDHEAATLFKWLKGTSSDVYLGDTLVQIDSYGGKINTIDNDPATFAREGITAVGQRSSIIKLQYQTYWLDATPEVAARQDKWINDFYAEMYSGPNSSVSSKYYGAPHPGTATEPSEFYEGCYIGYPDAAMIDVEDTNRRKVWPDLYYPYGLYSTLLVKVKGDFDSGGHFNVNGEKTLGVLQSWPV